MTGGTTRTCGDVGDRTVPETIPVWAGGNLLQALATFLLHDHDADVAALAATIVGGVTAFQYGPPGTYRFLAHPSFALDPQEWHAWGSRKGQALARASIATGDAAALASAEAEAGRFFVHRLGVSEQGNYQDDIRLVYADGSVDEIPLGLSDWCQTPRYGEAIAFEFAQRRGAGGAIERITCRILRQHMTVRSDVPLVRIDLPDRETMHVFALTLRHAR